jgi:hypothetical protein
MPELIATEKKSEFYDEFLESLLGTPRGELQHSALAPRLMRAKKTLAGAKKIFSPETQKYFEARIALAEGRAAEGQKKLEELKSLEGSIGDRARKFLAVLGPPDAQLAALEALPLSTDVLIRILDRDRARALAKLPATPPSPAQEPLQWLLHAYAKPNLAAPAEEAKIFRVYVGPALAKTNSPGLLSICAEVAKSRGLLAEETHCTNRVASVKAGRAESLKKRALAAGANRAFKEAAALLEEVDALVPGDRQVQTLRVRALVETGDEKGLTEQLQRMRFFGVSEEYLSWLVKEARSGKLGGELFEKMDEEEPSTDEPSEEKM